jgi:hypothetical protein
MTNGLLILYMGKYLRISSYIRKPSRIYDFATSCSTLNFHIYEENLIFFFISVEEKYEGKNYSRDREKVREKAKEN